LFIRELRLDLALTYGPVPTDRGNFGGQGGSYLDEGLFRDGATGGVILGLREFVVDGAEGGFGTRLVPLGLVAAVVTDKVAFVLV
jgi:hypothetical protein